MVTLRESRELNIKLRGSQREIVPKLSLRDKLNDIFMELKVALKVDRIETGCKINFKFRLIPVLIKFKGKIIIELMARRLYDYSYSNTLYK